MARILSIEVGNTITRICEMDYKVKNPRVYVSVSISTPKGVLEDGFIKENPEFTLAIREALVRNNIKTKLVTFPITASKIVTREVVLPAVSEGKIGAMIKSNASDYFPIDLSLYEIAYTILGKAAGDDGTNKHRVMVMAAGKDLIHSYRNLANACGLRLASIDYSGNSIYQVMKDEVGEGTELVIKLEEGSTIASVISNHQLVLQRHMAYGIDRVVESLVASSTFYENDYDSAFRAMCARACIKVALNDRTRVVEYGELNNQNDNFDEEYQKITMNFAQLIGNLTRVIELHNLKESNRPITHATIVGVGSDIVDIEKLFTNELGIKTVKLTNIRSASWSGGGVGEGIGRYVDAIGATFAPVNLVSTDNGGPTKEKKVNAMDYSKVAVVIAIIGIVAACAIAIPPIINYNNEVRRQNDLKALEVKYEEGEKLFFQCNNVKMLFLQVQNASRMTEHSNDMFLQLLDELEQKLPSDVLVAEIASGTEACELTLDVPQEDPLCEAAKIFQILRGFNCFNDVTIGTCESKSNDAENEDAISYMRFKAICYYKPITLNEILVNEDGSVETTNENENENENEDGSVEAN